MALDDVPMAALAELLCRRCVEPDRDADVPTAQRLLRAMADGGGSTGELLGVATGAVRAGFRADEDFGAGTLGDAREAARTLLRAKELTDTERLLLAASLALMAERAADDRAARDFMVVAISAQNVDQSELGRWAALRALAAKADLNAGQEAVASLVLAVITHDRSDILRAYELADALPADDPRARWAESLRPFLLPEGDGALENAGDAVRSGDRCAAAGSLARDFAQTHQETGDPLVEAMHRTMVALSRHEVDVDAARQGLYRVLVLLRARQRYGQVPPGVKAGVDMVSDLLHVEATPESADLLTELMEALADAGCRRPSCPRTRRASRPSSTRGWPKRRQITPSGRTSASASTACAAVRHCYCGGSGCCRPSLARSCRCTSSHPTRWRSSRPT